MTSSCGLFFSVFMHEKTSPETFSSVMRSPPFECWTQLFHSGTARRVEKVNCSLLLDTIAALCEWVPDGLVLNLTCQNRKTTVQAYLRTKKVFFPLTSFTLQPRELHSVFSSYICPQILCSWELKCHLNWGKIPVFFFLPNAALCSLCPLVAVFTPLLQSQKFLFPVLFSFSCINSPPLSHLLSLPTPFNSSSSCASCSLSHFSPLPPSYPFPSKSFSEKSIFSNLRTCIALFPWLCWQSSDELIYEPALGQCNNSLFVAYYQLPGAELFIAAQWPFVVWSCSSVQYRGIENKCKGSACIRVHYRQGRKWGVMARIPVMHLEGGVFLWGESS